MLGLVEGGHELAAFGLGGGDRHEQQVRLGNSLVEQLCAAAAGGDHDRVELGALGTDVLGDVIERVPLDVSTGLIRSLRQIIKESGLNPAKMTNQWPTLENGVEVWLASRHLRSLVLEIHDPSRRHGDDLVGRFDFTINYGYYPDADGELWLDPDTVYYTVRKAGAFPSLCDYRIVADNEPGRPDVAGWSTTSLRSTAGFTRHEVGTAAAASVPGSPTTPGQDHDQRQ